MKRRVIKKYKVVLIRHELSKVPCSQMFTVNGNLEWCNSTGYIVCFPQDNPRDWWGEYEDSQGEMHYGG